MKVRQLILLLSMMSALSLVGCKQEQKSGASSVAEAAAKQMKLQCTGSQCENGELPIPAPNLENSSNQVMLVNGVISAPNLYSVNLQSNELAAFDTHNFAAFNNQQTAAFDAHNSGTSNTQEIAALDVPKSGTPNTQNTAAMDADNSAASHTQDTTALDAHNSAKFPPHHSNSQSLAFNANKMDSVSYIPPIEGRVETTPSVPMTLPGASSSINATKDLANSKDTLSSASPKTDEPSSSSNASATAETDLSTSTSSAFEEPAMAALMFV